MFYSWGCGHDGRLGTGKEENVKEPTPIHDLIQKAVFRKIASAPSTNELSTPQQQQQQPPTKKKNAFGIEVENQIVASGNLQTSSNQAEVTTNSSSTASPLPYFKLRVNRIFAGGYHSFVECILENDEESFEDEPNALLLSFGGNEHGQLGVGDSSPRTSAQIVEPFFSSSFKNLQRRSVKYISKEKQNEYQDYHSAVSTGSKSGIRNQQNGKDEVEEEKEGEDSWANIGCSSASSHFSELLSKKKKRNTRGANFDISSEPYLWYRSEDLIDIKCGRYHSIAWVLVGNENNNNNNCRSEIYVCGRNDSGQLGLGAGEREDKTIFVDATPVLRMQAQENNANSEILDISCGAYHSCILLGPKDCFRSNHSSKSENLRQRFIQEWIQNQVQEIFRSHQKSKSAASKSQNHRNKDGENIEGEEKDFVKQQLELLKSQFSVFSCGRGDCGELGVDGDEGDSQADFESRIKAAVLKQHHRRQMMTDGSNSHITATAGTSSWALLQDRQQQQQTMNQNISSVGEYGSITTEGGVGEEEDETITSILDPAKRNNNFSQKNNNNNKLQAQTKFDSKYIFRVALLRDLWTRIDLSNVRIRLATPSENNSVSIPFRIFASYQRTSIQCAKISFSAIDEQNIISENIWLSFGAFYHNKRETLESSIPSQVIAPSQQEIMNIVGIEDCEILFTETEIFVRGGPRCSIIPRKGGNADDNEDEEEVGGESEGWTKISEKLHEKLSSPTTQKIKIENIFPQGKGFIALVSQNKVTNRATTSSPRRQRPHSASSSKSEENNNNNNESNDDDDNDDDDENDTSRIEFRLVSFGDNFYGQLGVGDETDRIGGNCDLVQSKFFVDQQQQQQEALVFDSNHKISFSVGVCHCGLMY